MKFDHIARAHTLLEMDARAAGLAAAERAWPSLVQLGNELAQRPELVCRRAWRARCLLLLAAFC